MYLPPKVTRRAFERLSEINAANEGKALRIAVEGGGCSGFQYEISLGNPTAEDLVIEEGGEKVLLTQLLSHFWKMLLLIIPMN